jgi:hypothetical protein
MTLDADQRVRFARHLLLTEIGSAGQERLCAAAVSFAADADPEAKRVAEQYLGRAGVRVGAGGADVKILDGDEIARLAGDPALVPAAQALAGAYAAVEVIKAVLGVGRAGDLEDQAIRFATSSGAGTGTATRTATGGAGP